MNRAESPQYFTRSPEQFGGKISFIVTDIVERLRELGGAAAEGVFRLSGPSSEVSDLCRALDRGRVNLRRYENVHTLACALKKYFRDLVHKDPLIPFEHYDEVVSIPRSSPDDSVSRYRRVISRLSAPRQQTLAYLFRFLREVTTASATSKMNAMNIAIVFAPNLLSPRGAAAESAEQQLLNNSAQNKAIALMVERADEIFSAVDVPQSAFVTDEDLVILSSPPIDVADIAKFAEVRALRRQSLIPFVPYELLQAQGFARPTRAVVVQKGE